MDELVRRCARLPIALTVAAARAVVRPHAPLVAELAELAELSTKDSAGTGLSTVFALFHHALTDQRAPRTRLRAAPRGFRSRAG
ncbi:hypothetical protein ACFV4N_15605 [Actinosynnema sp. NPDC059797]